VTKLILRQIETRLLANELRRVNQLDATSVDLPAQVGRSDRPVLSPFTPSIANVHSFSSNTIKTSNARRVSGRIDR
jgi:hypothetical protein